MDTGIGHMLYGKDYWSLNPVTQVKLQKAEDVKQQIKVQKHVQQKDHREVTISPSRSPTLQKSPTKSSALFAKEQQRDSILSTFSRIRDSLQSKSIFIRKHDSSSLQAPTLSLKQGSVQSAYSSIRESLQSTKNSIVLNQSSMFSHFGSLSEKRDSAVSAFSTLRDSFQTKHSLRLSRLDSRRPSLTNDDSNDHIIFLNPLTASKLQNSVDIKRKESLLKDFNRSNSQLDSSVRKRSSIIVVPSTLNPITKTKLERAEMIKRGRDPPLIQRKQYCSIIRKDRWEPPAKLYFARMDKDHYFNAYTARPLTPVEIANRRAKPGITHGVAPTKATTTRGANANISASLEEFTKRMYIKRREYEFNAR